MATPTITTVSGTIGTGNTLTVAGTGLVQESRATWLTAFPNAPTGGWGYSAGTWTYDTSTYLYGPSAPRNFRSGVSTNTSPVGAALYCMSGAWASSIGTHLWVRLYLRRSGLNLVDGPDYEHKFCGFWNDGVIGNEQQANYGLGPEGGAATCTLNGSHIWMRGTVNNTYRYPSNPPSWKQDAWQCVDLRFPRQGSSDLFEMYLDDVLVLSDRPVPGQGLDFAGRGFIEFHTNWYWTTANFQQYIWMDGIGLRSENRIGPASKCEIGNSSNYSAATKVHQSPVRFGDTSSQFTCDLTGLGAGPYYLWVTSNTGERSAAYSLGGVLVVPNAVFTPSVTSGQAPLAVSFNDQSTDNPDSWSWDFDTVGDTATPATSTSQNPSTTYNIGGPKTARLTVSNSAGTDPTPATQAIAVRYLKPTNFEAGQGTTPAPTQTIFFTEAFADASFSGRGWFDVTGGTIDTSVYAPNGGASSLRIPWPSGTTTPATPKRHLFTASDTVYLSCYMKFGTASVTWQGSGQTSKPHLIQLLTNADDDWTGPAWTYLSVRFETSAFRPRIEIQDGRRINASQLGVNLLGTATTHAIAGGNGNQATNSSYWFDGTDYWNNSDFDAGSNVFQNDTWHFVECYAAMNSIVDGIPQANGALRYWVDGNLIINQSALYLRTAQYATQKFDKLLLVPYMDAGSPITQDMWIDNLTVADKRI